MMIKMKKKRKSKKHKKKNKLKLTCKVARKKIWKSICLKKKPLNKTKIILKLF